MKELEFREVRDDEDVKELVRLQLDIWQFDDLQISPPDLLKVHKKLGGAVMGAFKPDGEAVAFCYSFCGLLGGRPMHWSHMLGVAKDWRGKGLGEKLKWLQRDHMLKQGVGLCQWTWDPLEAINTYLNVVKLGVISNTYEENIYRMTSGPLHTGLPTDRFVADWHLESSRVVRAAAGTPLRLTHEGRPAYELDAAAGAIPLPVNVKKSFGEEVVATPVIKGMTELKFKHPQEAMTWRMVTRELFQQLFAEGYSLVDVRLESRFGGNFVEYLLERKQP